MWAPDLDSQLYLINIYRYFVQLTPTLYSPAWNRHDEPGKGTSLEQAKKKGRLRGSTAYSTSPLSKAIFIESTVYIVINYL